MEALKLYIDNMIRDEFYPSIEKITESFNNKIISEMYPSPVVQIGDLIKNKEGSIWRVDSIITENFMYVSYDTDRDYKRNAIDSIKIRMSSANPYTYIVSRKLANKRWSVRSESLWNYQLTELSVLSAKDFEDGEFDYDNFKPINQDLDEMRLLYKVDQLLHEIECARYNEAIKKYSKKELIPKSVIEKNPEILELHNKVQELIKIRTHLNLTTK